MNKQKTVLLIPSLNPDEKLIKLVEQLMDKGFFNILIVNDGSSKETLKYFSDLEKKGCKIFTHFKNLGKGRALKDAFNFILNSYDDFKTVITLDSDGQHSAADVEKISEEFENVESNTLGLGARKFKGKDIPFRSKFGNIFSSLLLKILCGISVSDTQTGLRAFTKETMVEFLDVPGERFEYEMNMILSTREKNINIKEYPIETIYIEDNKSSHFNPIKDSFKIISRMLILFIKYIASSIISFALDFGFYALFVAVTKSWAVGYYIILSTIFARIISAGFNFIINKKTVFKQKEKNPKFLILYFVLVAVNMVLSALGSALFVEICHWNYIWSKVLVDGTLFILSFIIQRDLIFKTKPKKVANLTKEEEKKDIDTLNGGGDKQ